MIRDRLDDVLRGLLLLACVAGIMIVVMLLDSVAFSILVIGGAALAAFAGHRLSRGRAVSCPPPARARRRRRPSRCVPGGARALWLSRAFA